MTETESFLFKDVHSYFFQLFTKDFRIFFGFPKY